jgi:uncharacterized protein YciI
MSFKYGELLMLKQFVFFYLMKNKPEKMQDIIPDHINYWKESKLVNYSGGPFSDGSGGLILFETENLETATDLAMNDPFVVHEVIESKWVKEWTQE